MAGWIISHVDGGGHRVTHISDAAGGETLAGEFGPEVGVPEIIDTVLANAELADWIITPSGEPLIVGERPRKP